ncbi:MAG: amidohydrolase family protein [Armatimonadota bacterium]
MDREFYDEHLRDLLPARMLDVHMHVHRESDVPPLTEELRAANWATSVSHPEYLADDAEADYAKLFPNTEVSRLQFGSVFRGTDIEACNTYCAETADRRRVWALAVLDPTWSAERLHDILTTGRFMGVKPYWSLVPGATQAKVRLDDMIPPPQLEVLDQLGLVAILHVPGPDRIRDPHTRQVLRQWRGRYENLTLIVAHLGRAYCMPFAEASFADLADIDGLLFDCSAVLNPDVFELAFRTIGPRRIMWGTDFPVLSRLRGYRVWEGETYRNVVSGDYPWNTDRQPPDVEARYTYFIYEALKAMRAGAERAGLTSEDLADVFLNTAHDLLAT